MIANKETLNVMILDDEIGMCLGAQRVLKVFRTHVEELEVDVNYEITYATSITDFNGIFSVKNFDIILLDYKLPEGSGLDLLQKIKEKKQETIVIMITAYATFETAVQATKNGAYDFLPKPFTPEELRYAVKKASGQYLLAKHAKAFEEEKKKIRFQFISVLSHELKAPISAVEGYINILKNNSAKISEDDYKMMLNRSLIRLEGMRKLIYDLLDLTRIESGEKKRNLENINIIELVESAIDLLTIEAEKRNIKINFSPAQEIFFLADKNDLEIIFNNLISNAIKYNKDKGEVSIILEQKEQSLLIQVSDTGIGLSDAEAAKLFKDFMRIKNEDTVDIMGSGLGLSTVKKIARLYQGDVAVSSQKGAGSTFKIELKQAGPDS